MQPVLSFDQSVDVKFSPNHKDRTKMYKCDSVCVLCFSNEDKHESSVDYLKICVESSTLP